jgi:hypothetical protein
MKIRVMMVVMVMVSHAENDVDPGSIRCSDRQDPRLSYPFAVKTGRAEGLRYDQGSGGWVGR